MKFDDGRKMDSFFCLFVMESRLSLRCFVYGATVGEGFESLVLSEKVNES